MRERKLNKVLEEVGWLWKELEPVLLREKERKGEK